MLSVLEDLGRKEDKTRQDKTNEKVQAGKIPWQFYGAFPQNSLRAEEENSNALFRTTVTLPTLYRCRSIEQPLPERDFHMKKPEIELRDPERK